ncbi:MAG TPA: hypothetical protein VNQ76_04850 [Planctomicrobium sp.]|nr:hypothetical protein [Planctomicrobium sp.]
MNTVLRASPAVAVLADRLGAQEIRRRFWHFFPGIAVMAVPLVPHQEVVRLWVMLLVVTGGIILPALLAIRHQQGFVRYSQEEISPSVFGYVIPLAILFLLFRGALEIPLAVAAIISFGDGSATLCGLLTRGPKLSWNPRKSVAGLFAFMTVGTVLATSLYWVEAGPQVSLLTSLLVVAPVVVICAFVESLPTKWNDNLTVGATASVLIVIQHALLVGAF